MQAHKGLFQAAHGGTLFLDEIGDMPLALQVKLLRVLQEGEVRPVGAAQAIPVDVRIISATNADLTELIGAGEFREDLLYRLNLIAIHIPPLRERIDDIPLLAAHFLENVGNVYRRPGLVIRESAMSWLQHLPWHGNIRQLKHTIERAVLMSSKDILETEDFRMPLTMGSGTMSNVPPPGSMTLEEVERAMIIKCMEQFNGNISKVAEALGLSRAALYRRLEKFGLSS